MNLYKEWANNLYKEWANNLYKEWANNLGIFESLQRSRLFLTLVECNARIVSWTEFGIVMYIIKPVNVYNIQISIILLTVVYVICSNLRHEARLRLILG
jgi:hypothetical protein